MGEAERRIISKAILITDMPESCDMCDFVEHEHENGVFARMYCGVPGMGEDVSDYIACRPDNCPLVPMPKKRNYNSAMEEAIKEECFDTEDSQDYAFLAGKVKGWNDCIDAIEGKRNCAAVGVTAEEAADGACRLLNFLKKRNIKMRIQKANEEKKYD